METSNKHLQVRFPEKELLQHLKQLAKEDNRSLNGEILQALREFVNYRMKERKQMEIQYIDLSLGAQKVIDSFPEEQQFAFFAKPHGKGYQVKAVEDSKLELLEAQGGMGEGWMQVVFSQEQ